MKNEKGRDDDDDDDDGDDGDVRIRNTIPCVPPFLLTDFEATGCEAVD